MENRALDQLMLFVRSLGWGGCIGLWYALLGLVRVFERMVWTALADLLFWVVTAVASFLFLLTYADGRADGYVLAAIVGGAITAHKVVALPLAGTAERLKKHLRTRHRRRKARLGRKK